MSGTGAAHILVVLYPAQGHLIPLLDLTHHLSLHGLSITIVTTPKNLPLLSPLLSLHPSLRPLVLPFPSHPSIPPGVENVKDLPARIPNPVVIQALAGLRDPLTAWFRAHPSPPVAIISDFFAGWTEYLAADIGIPRIVFYSSGAFGVAAIDWLWDRILSELPTDSVVKMSELPGSPEFLYRQLPAVFRRYLAGGVEKMAAVKDGMVANRSSWGAVFNTFAAFESKYLDYYGKETGHSRIWAVGPLLPENDGPSGPVQRGGSSSTDVLKWLDSCPDGSVVYVCFGSQAILSAEQMAALGAGLEKSRARFVWTVKETSGPVPVGFEERVEGRGVVIRGWVPQVPILRHVAVGAFMTHCGWNSVLEGVAAGGGVCLLAWPMAAEQHVNARLLVEDLGVAVRVCEGEDSVPDSDELAKAVADSVSGDSAERRRALQLTEASAAAVVEGGSSWGDLMGLVKELQSLGVAA